MTSWTPTQRIVTAGVPRDFQLRGLTCPISARWPSTLINGGADYSVDFSTALDDGDRIVAAAADVGANGKMAWLTIFGSMVTIWAQWLTAGEQSVTISARTESGAVVSLLVSIIVSPVAALLKSTPSDMPPNALLIGNVYLPDATGAPLIAG